MNDGPVRQPGQSRGRGVPTYRSDAPEDRLARPAVSVVVPVFRTEEYLESCLLSLLNQTFTDFEVIVVDDASPDGGTVGIVDAIGDERVKVIRHQQNLGATQARITGVRAASGEYVSFVDSDDEVDERFLEVLHRAATRYDADMVQCALQQREVDGSSRCVNRGGERHDLSGEQTRRAMLVGEMSNSLCNKLMRTELVLSVYGDASEHSGRVDYGEDLLTLFDLVSRVDRFAHVPEPVYRYLRRATSITVRSNAEDLVAKVKSLSAVLDRILPTLLGWAEPPELVEQFLVREFLEPAVDLLERSRASGALGSTASTASAAEFGLLGAVVEWERSHRARWESEAQRLRSDVDDLREWIADRDPCHRRPHGVDRGPRPCHRRPHGVDRGPRPCHRRPHGVDRGPRPCHRRPQGVDRRAPSGQGVSRGAACPAASSARRLRICVRSPLIRMRPLDSGSAVPTLPREPVTTGGTDQHTRTRGPLQ